MNAKHFIVYALSVVVIASCGKDNKNNSKENIKTLPVYTVEKKAPLCPVNL